MNGADLIALGFKPGPYFPDMLKRAAPLHAAGASDDEIRQALSDLVPPPPLDLRHPGEVDFGWHLEGEHPDEKANAENVRATMEALMRTPVVKAGAIMPDACPSGPMGTIPVGGVVASEHIHPGMHSADICCSVALSVLDCSPPEAMEAIARVTHFGPGGRDEFRMPDDIAQRCADNAFLSDQISMGHSHMGTQGDGNHFAFVGTLKSTGQTALVTHHGSRGIGARLYKAGMKAAEKNRADAAPEVAKGNAWIPADTRQGDDYWEALQIIRAWSRRNHFVLHDAVGVKVLDRFWNEHNFVFRKSDGLFYHGKGATPAFDGWAEDATDLTLIPLNMAEPVLIARGRNRESSLGFSPHGAGRNYSRTEHRRRGLADLEAETKGLDVRFHCGIPDPSELPSAYKNAAEVRRQIEHFDLAEIVDEVLPHGSIMAGDWQVNAPWRKKRA